MCSLVFLLSTTSGNISYGSVVLIYKKGDSVCLNSLCIICCSQRRKDLLQLMLDAKDETGAEKLDNEDIQAQTLVFLLAGYETSSTTLGFLCYHLALNTHLQDKLRDEIDRIWSGDEVGHSCLFSLDDWSDLICAR